MPNEAALPSVGQHAQDLLAKFEQQRVPDAAAAAAAAGQTPAFGTTGATIDASGQTQAVRPADPAFSGGTHASPEQTAGAPTSPADAAAATPQAPAPAPAAAAAPTTADAAANAAALDLEEWEFEDPDLQVKIPLRFPKQFANTVKRAFPRRADYDRLKLSWKEYGDMLEPLLRDGRFRQIAPLLQRALTDPAYGDYVYQGYERAMRGQPLVQQAIAQAQQMAAAPPAMPTPVDAPLDDPWLAQALKPYQSELQTIRQQFQTLQQQREAEERQRLEVQQRQAAQAQQMAGAHQDLELMYPGQYKAAVGPADPNWQRALQAARDYGYLDRYDLRAAIVFGAQKAMELEAERLAATASPAAQSIAAVDARLAEQARIQAASLAASGGGGAPAITQPPSGPPPKPSQYQADGKTLKPPEQFYAELQAWLKAGGRA